MTVDKVTELVCKYVEDEFAKIQTKNKMSVEMVHGGEPWVVSCRPSVDLFCLPFR